MFDHLCIIISSSQAIAAPGLRAQALSIDKLGHLGHGRPESSVDVWGFEVSPEVSPKNIKKTQKTSKKIKNRQKNSRNIKKPSVSAFGKEPNSKIVQSIWHCKMAKTQRLFKLSWSQRSGEEGQRYLLNGHPGIISNLNTLKYMTETSPGLMNRMFHRRK